MYTKILIPLDGSRLSEAILPYARSFAKGIKIPVELLQVIEPAVVSTFSDAKHGRYLNVVEASMKRNSIDYLNQVAESFPDRSAVTCSAELGNPAQVIIDRGSMQGGTLIAMSTHGRSGVRRWLLGSVADKVLHAAGNPLLLVRSTDKSETTKEAAVKTVIVPLDGSNLAEGVLPYVTGLAKEMDLEVILLRVTSRAAQAYVVEAEAFMPAWEKLSGQIREEARGYLEQKVQQLEREGVGKISYLLLEGDAAGEISDAARETGDNLVAMSTHGRSGIGRWVIGSVTDRVVRHSVDPVLVVRAAELT